MGGVGGEERGRGKSGGLGFLRLGLVWLLVFCCVWGLGV